MTRKATRLYPLPPHELPAENIYADLELPPAGRPVPPRPYVAINMVSSIDGRTTIAGKASRLGSATDRRAMRTLRSRADAVMIGANTLRAEKLSLSLDEPGYDPQPLAVILTNSGNVPLESNLVVGESQQVVVIAPENLEARLDDRARVLRVPATPAGNVDLREALRLLNSEHAVEMLLVEGGPTLNHALVRATLVDELFLTLAPKLLGASPDEGMTILSGHKLPSELSPLTLRSVHLVGDELFLRYALFYDKTS